MGHTPWWIPSKDSPPEVREFVRQTRRCLDGLFGPSAKTTDRKMAGCNTPSAASDAYLRYVKAYEAQITPKHSNLQARFEHFLVLNGASDLKPNVAGVDLRYRDGTRGTILAEIKPCELANARYAIRTAMGQLLDYRQRAKENMSLLIVLEKKPNEEDQLLAISNGFGIAYPITGKFELFWPGFQALA
ncbi:hypothetical protein MES4922_10043 [Mesorhizobium ventifaucium]|uniref:Uncharacterized protein n=2 Tax=Mesorhizobium ventifaucium TaxID=666020 RepID=A0ABN8J8N8_9HYPH|nr:hypothetical protein MES4922_10043 [Mesorhizobium ventifaucium]